MVDGRIRALGTPAELKEQYAAGSMDEVFRILARTAKRSGIRMKGFFSFVRKETLHILRDRRDRSSCC